MKKGTTKKKMSWIRRDNPRPRKNQLNASSSSKNEMDDVIEEDCNNF